MIKNESSELAIPLRRLRDPDLCIEGFELWIHGRQFPQSDDYWDGNWLEITACCRGDSAFVQTVGPFLHLSQLQNLVVECKKIYDSLSGEAHLHSIEPNLALTMKMKSRGRFEFLVFITPDNRYQSHSFIFDLDQSYLLHFIQGLEEILRSYPLK